MVHHIVMWNLKEELNAQEKKEAAVLIKEKLEAVKEVVEGIVSLEVVINQRESSNKDVGLISVFETAEALEAYQKHPAHVEAAGYIKMVTCDRVCLDY
ncbi:MAG: Dabb family protein [Lachnospiraceae bacterium]|nr:Dabb family protein [Lachnospiraceae bacterium]